VNCQTALLGARVTARSILTGLRNGKDRSELELARASEEDEVAMDNELREARVSPLIGDIPEVFGDA
jgi:hypothetical protein